MAIIKFDKERFQAVLHEVVFPANPVNSIEHLFGREAELDRIEKAIAAPGRHVFIYGDRGVGKSSLAASAANQYQSSDAAYIDVSCSRDSSFASVLANIAYQAVKVSRTKNITTQDKFGIEYRCFQIERVRESSSKDIFTEIRTVEDAVEILKEVCVLHSERPVVVIDEFDRMADSSQRALFADLLKQIGDKRIGVKFIITGVGASLDELLGSHQSAFRQLEPISLPKLSWDSRWEILRSAMKRFGIAVDHEVEIRVAAISDGYPYYIHLLAEKILWKIFESDEFITRVSQAIYIQSLYDAIESIHAELKKPYEKAMSQNIDECEEILWATADSDYLIRSLEQMYGSYKYVLEKLGGNNVIPYERFCTRIRSLKTAKYGEILIPGKKPGLYTYKEKMLRGYVRMQAEANGVELLSDVAQPTERQHTLQTVRASTGYKGSKVPAGINFKKKRD